MAEAALAAVASALAHWPIEAEAITALGSAENIVFKVEDPGGAAFVLRFHRPGYHDLAELESEQRWTRALLDAGIDVPEPVMSCAGAGYVLCPINGEQRYAGLLKWVSGAPLNALIDQRGDLDYMACRFADIGVIFARLHEQATRWQAPSGFTRHAFDADGLMGETPFWGRFWEADLLDGAQRRRFAALRSRIHPLLASFAKDAAGYSMIHGDLHPGNVIVNGDRLHIIDFDDAGFGWHSYDFAVALAECHDHPDLDTLCEAMFEGYRLERPLPSRVHAEVRLLLLARAMAQVGWLDARPELDFGDWAQELFAYVDEQADTMLAAFD